MRERMGMEYEAIMEVVWKRVVGKGVHGKVKFGSLMGALKLVRTKYN